MYPVLVPVDRDEQRAAAQAEAVTRLPAAAESVEATVLYVYEPGEDPATPEDVPSGQRALRMLEDAGVRTRTENRRGDPAEEILVVAEELGAELIVLGGRKRSPLGTLLFGSVSQAVTLEANRPVTVTGAEVPEHPSHRCRSCGQTYYTDPASEIGTCRRCGGTTVEALRDDEAPPHEPRPEPGAAAE